MNDRFKVTVCSLPDYDELVAEIYIDDEFIALLSQESDPTTTVLEIAPQRMPLKVELDVFESALAHAKSRLLELRKRG